MSSKITIEKVAVVDDDEDSRQTMFFTLEDAGYLPIEFDNLDSDVTAAADAIGGLVDAAVCDHRLRYGGLASYDGAELAACLIERQIPTILVTQYLEPDQDTTIRRHRREIAVVLSRDEASSERIRQGLELTVNEMAGDDYILFRRPRRALVVIKELMEEGGEVVVDAVIPTWNPDRAIRFPVALVETELVPQVKAGVTFLAEVNVDARDSSELYLANFSVAPDPVEDSEIG